MSLSRPPRAARAARNRTPAHAGEVDTDAPTEISLRSLDGFVSFHLRRTRNLLAQRYTAAAVNPGVPLGSLTALAAIVDNPGISQSVLGRQLGLNKSTTVVLLDTLCDNQWAERRPSKTDRRAHSLFALQGGKEKLEEMRQHLRAIEDQALNALTIGERDQLLELLRKAGAALLPAG